MSGEAAKLTGPDLERDGVALDAIGDGEMLLGHAMGEGIVVVRRGDRLLAVGATCTHYGGPLGEGALEGDSIRCPWHHACFDLRTGEAIAAPALAPVACFDVATQSPPLFLIGKKSPPPRGAVAAASSVVIIGGGAAGFATAEMLRRRGF